MIRLIGIDIDGTLLDGKGVMPEANRTTIHAAVASGVHVALVTGRSYPVLEAYAMDDAEAAVVLLNTAAEAAGFRPCKRCRPNEPAPLWHSRQSGRQFSALLSCVASSRAM